MKSFIKEIYNLFCLMCVAFSLAYMCASLNNLDTNLFFGG